MSKSQYGKRIEDALESLYKGKMVIVVDDFSRENEGDLVAAAEKATPATINFMAGYGRGLICQPLTIERAEALRIPLMVARQTDPHCTAFTVSVDHRSTSTGISAFDRARTVNALTDPGATPEDFVSPGHVFPLIAEKGGVFSRKGHTEAAVDLARLAGFSPSGVICEIMNDDGTMARMPHLRQFARKHRLPLLSIEDLVRYRDAIGDVEITLHSESLLPTDYQQSKKRTSDKKCRNTDNKT